MTDRKPVSELEKQVRPLEGEASLEEARSKALLYATIERQRIKVGKGRGGR